MCTKSRMALPPLVSKGSAGTGAAPRVYDLGYDREVVVTAVQVEQACDSDGNPPMATRPRATSSSLASLSAACRPGRPWSGRSRGTPRCRRRPLHCWCTQSCCTSRSAQAARGAARWRGCDRSHVADRVGQIVRVRWRAEKLLTTTRSAGTAGERAGAGSPAHQGAGRHQAVAWGQARARCWLRLLCCPRTSDRGHAAAARGGRSSS